MYIYTVEMIYNDKYINVLLMARNQEHCQSVMLDELQKRHYKGSVNYVSKCIGLSFVPEDVGVILFTVLPKEQAGPPNVTMIELNGKPLVEKKPIRKVKSVVNITVGTPITYKEFGLSKRVQNILVNAHQITTVGMLVGKTKKELLKMAYLGPKLVQDIIDCLTEHKLQLHPN